MKKISKLHFGRIVIDKTHKFMGKSDPILFVIADTWVSSDYGLDTEIWVDHYRGHFKIPIKHLLDSNLYEITNLVLDCSKNIRDQLDNLTVNKRI